MYQQKYAPLPPFWHAIAAREENCVLLETARCDPENHRSFLFRNPVAVLSIQVPDDVPALLGAVERCLAAGHYVAGFFGYECGYHFERVSKFSGSQIAGPLAWLGVYRCPAVFDHLNATFSGDTVPEVPPAPAGEFTISNCRLEIAPDQYANNIKAIRDYIAAGDTYQVNFTDQIRFGFSGSPASLYAALRERQRVPYGALIHHDGWYVLSFSPEMFFRISGSRIVTRPMKGTTHRGRNVIEDAERAAWLGADPKNRSENVMIVDLLRNDLGRICQPGSVRVENMFAVERYETLLQMTSTICGQLRPGASLYEIFRAIFPCGSITGAPKVRTMQIIGELERRPRGVYTGAIGFFSPAGEAVFNVAIRTILLKENTGTMGVGGGIVYDSRAEDEYRECCLKAEFLTQPVEPFKLLESLLWKDGYWLLEEHLARLGASCEYFDFPFDRPALVAALHDNTQRLTAGMRYKVRLLLDREGRITLENTSIGEVANLGRITFSPFRTSSADVFLFHKTTRRGFYDRLLAEAQQAGFTDLIFLNERDEVTEGAANNIFVEKDGRLMTPPVSCGLLPGTFRAHLLATNPQAQEHVLRQQDLETADAIYLCNSVRGLRRVTLAQAASAFSE